MSPLRIEPLETRCVPTTITPKTFDDGLGIGSLRDAVLQCNADPSKEDCTILLSASTYTLSIRNASDRQENAALTGDLDVTSTAHRLILQGEEAATVIDASELRDRVFQIVSPGTQVIFQGLVIRGGLAQDDGSAGTLAGTTTARGGGILNNGGNITFDNVVIGNNVARGGDGFDGGGGRSAQGGGLYSIGGSLIISGSTIASNQSIGGDGAEGWPCQGPGWPPTAGGEGGPGFGGAIWASESMVSITNATISANAAHGGTGGIGGLFHRGCLPGVYSGGQGGVGGPGFGGGIYASGGMLTVANATISANAASGGSGGRCGNGDSSYFGGQGGNGHNGQGGGLFCSRAMITLTSATISANSVRGGDGGRGGPGAGGEGSAGLPGTGQGGGVSNASGSVTARNTLFANTAATSHPDFSGDFASASYNLLSNGTGSNLTDGIDGNRVGSAKMPLDPLLGELQDNGGPTLTHALLPGSPALDAGDNEGAPEWDQRGEGYFRIVNGVIDIGAFEAQESLSPRRSPVSIPGSLEGVDPAALLLLELPSRRDPFRLSGGGTG